MSSNKVSAMIVSATMAPVTVAPVTMAPPSETCLFQQIDYDEYCLIPALFIITVLAFINKRVNLKPNVCHGRPALVLPMNFLGDITYNRLSIAVAFGAIASNCFQIFNSIAGFETISTYKSVDLGNSHWEKACSTVVKVLLYGCINFPLLACLTADNQFVGSIFGLLYTLMRFVIKMMLVITCKTFKNEVVEDLSQAYKLSDLFLELPILICYLFLLVRFMMILYHEIRKRRRYRHLTQQINKEEERAEVARRHDFIHVHLLLKNQLNQRMVGTQAWYIRLRNFIYMQRKDFKFSIELISTLTVGAVFVYHMTVYFVLYFSNLKKKASQQKPESKCNVNDSAVGCISLYYYLKLVNVIHDAFFISTSLTCLLSIILMLHFMKSHRSHVLKSYRTKTFLSSPSRLVVRNLSYPGYQIAHIGLSYFIMLILLIVVWSVIIIIIHFQNEINWRQRFSSISPYIIIPILIWLFQYFLGWIVFRDRRFPNLTITVNNHRLYCIMAFFFFFFNILVGFYSSIFRTLKSMVLGVFFLSRLDRTPLMAGYESWDNGYLSYVGFLNVLKSYSHPVMLVFCHLLTHRNRDMIHTMESDYFVGDRTSSSQSTRAAQIPFSSSARAARNRWLVAYTLLRNPQLRAFRKHNVGMTVSGFKYDTVVIVPTNCVND